MIIKTKKVFDGLLKLFIVLFFVSIMSCNDNGGVLKQNIESLNTKENSKIFPDNMIRIDSNRIGLVLPDSFAYLPGLFADMKKIKPELIYFGTIGNSGTSRGLFSVCKIRLDSISPMEIFFMNNVVKFNSINLDGKESKLIDFGVFDKNEKRYRYKIIKYYSNQIKFLYWFMENDSSQNVYELSITTGIEYEKYDLEMFKIAESFTFLK